ncbi:hypothetical protein [Burkholderia dolosa]|uniref:hypothetical protein n=1 Tax=Burkholderia dolosa TaxID=152500 RepID=UPI001BA31562|nr:hypothetical protein [Burkholderia dolosa]
MRQKPEIARRLADGRCARNRLVPHGVEARTTISRSERYSQSPGRALKLYWPRRRTGVHGKRRPAPGNGALYCSARCVRVRSRRPIAWRERHIATNCIRACRARLCSHRESPPDDTDDVSLRARCADASVRIRLRVSDEQIVVFEQQSDAVEAIGSAAIEPYARTAPGNRTLEDRPGAAVFEAVEHTPTSIGKPRRLAAPRSRRSVGRFVPRHFF